MKSQFDIVYYVEIWRLYFFQKIDSLIFGFFWFFFCSICKQGRVRKTSSYKYFLLPFPQPCSNAYLGKCHRSYIFVLLSLTIIILLLLQKLIWCGHSLLLMLLLLLLLDLGNGVGAEWACGRKVGRGRTPVTRAWQGKTPSAD